MTLDEAILKHKTLRKSSENHNDKRGVFYSSEEHEQFAEWLEELKEYRKHIELTEIPEQYKLGFQDGIVNGFENGYNKAIDDFVRIFKSKTSMENGLVDEIAEQLKEGGENE